MRWMEWRDTFLSCLGNIKQEEKLRDWKDTFFSLFLNFFSPINIKQKKVMVWWDTSSPLWPAGQLLMERLPEIKQMRFPFHFFGVWLLMGRRAPEMKSFWTSTMMIALFGRTIWSLSIWITVNKRFSRFENWHLFDREDFKNIEKTWKILRRL